LNEIPEIDEISFVVTPSEPETTFEILDLIVHACIEAGMVIFLLFDKTLILIVGPYQNKMQNRLAQF